MEFFNYSNRVKPRKGCILVSEPYLPDPNFERTIILLCEHNAEGSFGFVLNKPSHAKIEDVMESIRNFDAQVYVGGPVQQDTLHYLHRVHTLEDAVEVGDGIYWGGNFEQLNLMLLSKQLEETELKFFLGYSGWSQGQLEEELNANSWIVSDNVDEKLIFETNPEMMWQKALKAMGGRFSVYSNYPVDPRLN
ncbi:MAG: YqgE/AlgH family protein [Bacteroidia bacterium]|nr:YqgE/AlgH family protein [Bacteroidia bacterium]